MSNATTGPGFDPRYDPRYQRGWVDVPTDGADAAPPGDPVPVPVPAPSSAAGAVAPALAEPGPSAAHSEATQPGHPLGVAPSTSAPTAPAGDAAHHGPGDDPSDPSDADDPGDPAARVLRIASGIAWGIALGAVVVGAGLVWSLVSRAPAFSAPTDPAELIVQGLAQYAAPSMLTTGLLAVVVLTVVDGFRRARSTAQRTAGAGGRRA